MVGYAARGIGSMWMQTPAGWAVDGVNANGDDQHDDYSFFARV